MEIKEFRKVNGITQEALADYLCTSKPYISLIESGKSKLSREKLQKLLNNDKGWDVLMLTAPQGNIYNNASGSGTNTNNVNIGNTQALEEKIAMLEQQLQDTKEQLEFERKRSADYWELLKMSINKSRGNE